MSYTHTHTQRCRVRGDFSNSERLLYQSLASTIQYYIKPLNTIAMCVHNFDIQLVYLGRSVYHYNCVSGALLDEAVNTHTVLYSHKGILIAKG